MRKTHKRLLGFLSLGLVAAMTIFAATLPIPGAKATTSTSQMTDTITVTVVGRQLAIEIKNPKDGEVFVNPSQTASVEQTHATTVTITGVHRNADGVETSFNIGTYPQTDEHSIITTSLDLSIHGYGTYIITAEGTDGTITEEDIHSFTYVPITADVDDDDKDDDEVYVDLDYQVGDVCSADVNVYLGDQLMVPPSPIHVEAPTTRVKIPVDGFETGKYTVKTTAYDCPNPGEDPEPLPFPYIDTFDYEKDEDIPVPDTGGFFMGMNISKTDYLVTAIIVFFAFAALALWIVIKGRKNNKRR